MNVRLWQRGIIILFLLLSVFSCTRLDDIELDITEIKNEITDLKTAVSELQEAYDEGKIITSVLPYTGTDGRSGWCIKFSDNQEIVILDGVDGITPLVKIDDEGYWCVSYNDGETYNRIVDGEGNYIVAKGDKGDTGDKGDKGDTGDKGDSGMSVRIVVDNEGNYVIETYLVDAPDVVLERIVTEYHSNPSNIIASIIQDELTMVITLTMTDGRTFSFNLQRVYPTGIVLLASEYHIEPNGEVVVSFRVNPSDALFSFVPDESVMLDKVTTTRSKVSYVTSPENYQLLRVEESTDASGAVKKGQYHAVVKDLGKAKSYDETIAIVIVTTNERGDTIAISSNIATLSLRPQQESFTSFRFAAADNPGLQADIELDVTGRDIVTCCIPYMTDFSQMTATFTTCAKAVLANGVEQYSGASIVDFSRPVTYKLVSESGSITTIKICLSNLPFVTITTTDSTDITDKETWRTARVTIDGASPLVAYNEEINIRGRGNSTWNYPKKPYAIKLNKKASILGMPAHKRWVLLANWMDRTLMRNHIAFAISKATGLAWTPRGEFVEVVLNGEPIGNYYLCEQIKVDENRVNIAAMTSEDTEGEAITGGYLLELDNHYDEVNKFRSKLRNLPVMIKEPDEDVINAEQLKYIEDYFNATETLIYSRSFAQTRGYTENIDVTSYIDWWIVHELSGNSEASWPKSSYMYKDRAGKLFAGPVWDFDWGTFVKSGSFQLKNALWYNNLFNDAAFKQEVKARWIELYPALELVAEEIDRTIELLRHSDINNQALWPITNVVNGDESLSFDEAVARLKANYLAQLAWMDGEIGNW